MILTDKEMQQVRQSIEAQAGLDEELLRRCDHLLHVGAVDEAVRSAFVLLEERLRKVAGREDMTGTQLANFAFSAKDGPLAKHLGRTQSEREGLRELYSGAFKLFRNPAAHGAVGYNASDGKAIIGLVNLGFYQILVHLSALEISLAVGYSIIIFLGSGAYTLWLPENNLIYRRPGDKKKPIRQNTK